MTSTILQNHLPGLVEVEFQSPGFKLMLLLSTSQKWPTKPEFFQLINILYFGNFIPLHIFSLHFIIIRVCCWSLYWNCLSLLLAFWIHEWRDAVSNRKVLILGLVLACCHLSRVGTSHCMVLVSPFSFVHQKKSTRWPQIVIQFWCSARVWILLFFPKGPGV